MAKPGTRGRDGAPGGAEYNPRVETVIEAIVDDNVIKAGGRRAFEAGVDRNGQEPKNADYIIETTAIELKIIESDGLSTPEVQAKIAKLFGPYFPKWPIVPVDPSDLSKVDLSEYENIVGKSVRKTLVKAEKQLQKTRLDNPDLTHSVIMVINNHGRGFDYDILRAICLKGLRNDAKQVDGVLIVSVDMLGDGFDTMTSMPFVYYARNGNYDFDDESGDEGYAYGQRPSFPGYEALLNSWEGYRMRIMNQTLFNIGKTSSSDRGLPSKGTFSDAIFQHEAVTYVLPAPHMGPSDFYRDGRPRLNTSGITTCPPVCTILIAPENSHIESLRPYLPVGQPVGEESINRILRSNQKSAERPIAAVRDLHGWDDWLIDEGKIRSRQTLFSYTNKLLSQRLGDIAERAIRTTPDMTIPSGSIFAKCTPIGMDMANDVSEIYIVGNRQRGQHRVMPLEGPIRMFEQHALLRAAAWALTYDRDTIYYDVNRKYGWY
jgi:hypothetical protein